MISGYDKLGIFVEKNEDLDLSSSEIKEAEKILQTWLEEQLQEAEEKAATSPDAAYLKKKSELEMAILEKLGIRKEVLELLSLEPGYKADKI